jgi:SAM-dependent methyltransferase
MPDADELKRMYTAEYFDPGGHCRPLTPGGYFENERRIRQEAGRLLTHLPNRAGKFLEIGCAGGFFLDEARNSGFDVTGLELSEDMATHARDKLKLNVRNISVMDAEFDINSFDVIASNRVLEHIPDIFAVFQKIHDWLRPGGILLVSGPFEQSTRNTMWYYINKLRQGGPKAVEEPPYHVHGFSRPGWYALMNRAGFRPIKLLVGADRVHLRANSVEDVVTLPIEIFAWLADKLSRRGTFMVAVSEVIKSSQPKTSVR